MTSVSFSSLSHPTPTKFYFSTIKYLQILYFICSSIVWQSVSSSYCRYHSLSQSPPQQNFWQLFLVFGKCGVTPHRLYSGSLTLIMEVIVLIVLMFPCLKQVLVYCFVLFKSSPPDVFLRKYVLKIYSKFKESTHANVWFQ